MGYEEELAAVGARADTQIRDRNVVIDNLGQDLEAQQLVIDGLRAQNTKLAADLKACQESKPPVPPDPPVPPVTKIRIGATVGSNDGGLNLLADVRRCYDIAGNGAREAVSRVAQNGLVWVNYKGSVTDAALRGDLQALVNMLKPKNLTGLVTYEHEPDIKGGIPLDVYHAGYKQLEAIIAEFLILEPIVCLTGFTGDKDPSIWENYSRPAHKMIGFDHYNKGHQTTGEPMSTPTENYGKMITWSKSKGKPMCIGETGVGDDAVAGPVIKTQAQWYSEHRKFVLDPKNNIAVACAFDSGLAILNQIEAKAWFGV